MLEFLQTQWNNFYTWFIVNSNWVTVLRSILLLLVELIVIIVVLNIVKREPKKHKSRISKLARTFLVSILKVVLIFVFIMTLLSVLGINVSNIVTAVGAFSIALSFAISEIATNFASGLILIGNKPFNEGDYIACNGVEGTVVSTAMFSTRLLTVDNKVVVIPNAVLATNSLTNYSTMPTRRVDLQFNVSYDSKAEKVQQVMTQVLDAHNLIRHDDGYCLRLASQGESALTFTCRFWVETKDYWDVYFDVNEAMLKAFKENGIEIPYNKLDVNLLTKN